MLGPLNLNGIRGGFKRSDARLGLSDDAYMDTLWRAARAASPVRTRRLTPVDASSRLSRRQFGSLLGGYSLALFDLTSAKQINGSLYEAKAIEFKLEEVGNPYFTPDS